MQPFFNTAGPCIEGKHHMLPPERRLQQALKLIEQEKYFVLRAGRQTGKTTSARWMVDHLQKTGRYEALWVDLQTARERANLQEAFPLLLDAFVDALSGHPTLPCPRPDK
nr:ATP-binding protein [Polyangiaceae bacterium]